jgi:hypothetical protein
MHGVTHTLDQQHTPGMQDNSSVLQHSEQARTDTYTHQAATLPATYAQRAHMCMQAQLVQRAPINQPAASINPAETPAPKSPTALPVLQMPALGFKRHPMI